jgi:DNA-binding LytR/AlgR family response regulator
VKQEEVDGMKSIFICDDDMDFLKRIKVELENDTFIKKEFEITCFTRGNDIWDNQYIKDAYGIFLDIELGDENGIELAKRLNVINPNIKIFFVSNHDNLVFEAIHARPVRFIRKSSIESDIKESIQFIQKDYKSNANKILFGEGTKAVEIPVADIKYLVNNGHYIELHIGTEQLRLRGKVADYVDCLAKMDFVQIQKGIMVNMEHIDYIKSGRVVMKDNQSFNISREKKEIVSKVFLEYLRRGME